MNSRTRKIVLCVMGVIAAYFICFSLMFGHPFPEFKFAHLEHPLVVSRVYGNCIELSGGHSISFPQLKYFPTNVVVKAALGKGVELVDGHAFGILGIDTRVDLHMSMEFRSEKIDLLGLSIVTEPACLQSDIAESIPANYLRLLVSSHSSILRMSSEGWRPHYLCLVEDAIGFLGEKGGFVPCENSP